MVRKYPGLIRLSKMPGPTKSEVAWLGPRNMFNQGLQVILMLKFEKTCANLNVRKRREAGVVSGA